MRLAGTASPLRREGRPRRQSRHGLWSASQASALVCPAGVEPAISGAQSRRGGQSPLQAAVNRHADAGLAGVGFPALNRSRSRSKSSWLGGAEPDFDRSVPPAGLEPAASGLRVRRHSRSTTGARIPRWCGAKHPMGDGRRRCRLCRRRPPTTGNRNNTPIEVIMAPAKPSRTSIGHSAKPSRTSSGLL
jgi:hypothetical protein